MNIKDFTCATLESTKLDSILGGTDFIGEDDGGFIVEDDILLNDFIGEEDEGI